MVVLEGVTGRKLPKELDILSSELDIFFRRKMCDLDHECLRLEILH